MRLVSLSWFLVVWLSITSDGLRSQEPDAAAMQFFEQRVRPLLVEKCYECHSVDAQPLKGGLRLDARAAILSGGDTGPAAIPGQPESSLLMRAVHYEDPTIEMPPTGKLRSRDIEIFDKWIRLGVPFPESSAAQPQRRSIDIEQGKRHWAFLPLGETRASRADNHQPTTAIGTLQPEAWQRGRIDFHVRAAQVDRHLEPAAEAAKEKLLRRIKFDLLGLPPSIEELDEFAGDSSPDALERRVDRWLASPRYGERWSRFWLELVRYCDVAESWAETQGNAYLYRDWVVASLNADMPFDRFSKLQLAADMMDDAQPSDLAALGFLGLSPTYWKELQLPVEIIKTIVADEYEERVHTLSSTFFGLNMACARCHDHKFDPITTEDYYALAGVFASTRLADRALAPGIDSLKVYEARKQVEKWEGDRKKLEAEIKKLAATVRQSTTDSTNDSGTNSSATPQNGPTNSEALTTKQSELDKLVAQIESARAVPGFDLPLAPGALDGTLAVKEAIGTHGSRIVYEESPRDAAVEIRGNPNKPSDIVPRRFVAVLSQGQPPHFTQGSGRKELANSMFEHSPALVARVQANRIWKHHFGIGIVDTPSDFGIQGEPPSHPELLDELAENLIAHEWSNKWLHRQIVLSATYRQRVCARGAEGEGLEKKWYVGAPLRRLDVEQWRDAMLVATGTLDGRLGGPASELAETTHNRRTLYGIVRRRELSDILRLNDFPDPLTHSPGRVATTTPLQQLFVLNSPFMLEQSAALATRLVREAPEDNRNRIELAYRLLFARSASATEIAWGLHFLDANPTDGWVEYAHALLGSNEFNFVD